MSDRKNPTAVQIGQRIKQARKMAGYRTASRLLQEIPHWGSGRLGNYEAGISMPSPDDIKMIAAITGTSPCWIMFGSGPIRASGRDLQAIRHQNLVYLFDQARAERGKMNRLLKAIGLSRKKLEDHVANPFLTIADRVARKLERFESRPAGWLDQQHVESDPVCAAFPDDMRRLMEIYSGLDPEQRDMLLDIASLYAARQPSAG